MPREYTEEEVEEFGVDTDHEIYVNRVMTENIPDAMSWEMVREATRKDPELKMLQEDIQAGQCRNAL